MTDIANDVPRPRRKSISVRKILGWLHLWMGVIFSIPFAAVGLSGSLWMLVRDIPAPIEAPAPAQHTIADIIAVASAQAPEGARPAAFDAASGDRPATVRFTNPQAQQGQGGRGGFGARIAVDPATLAAGPVPQQNSGFGRLMHDIHGHLLIEGGFGRPFVGWLGVFMVGLGLTGIIMWWPVRGGWKRAFKIKLDGGLLRSVFDLHRVCGITTLIVFLIVCLSGVYIVFPQPVSTLSGVAAPQGRGQPDVAVTPVEGQIPLDIDGVVALAQASLPNGVLRSVTIPTNPRQGYRLSFNQAGDYTGAPQANVVVDQWQHKVVSLRNPDELAANSKFIAWQRALHAGVGLGMWWWVLVFISGLLPVLFAITGLMMWWMRRKVR